jgi:hypothetical protein
MLMNTLTALGKIASFDRSSGEMIISVEDLRKPAWEPDRYTFRVADHIMDAVEKNFRAYGSCLVAVQGELAKGESGVEQVARFVTFLVDAPVRTASIPAAPENNIDVVTIEELEVRIHRTEGFAVRFKHPNGRDVDGRKIVGGISIRRSADTENVGSWKDRMLRLVGFDSDVLSPTLEPMHGNTLLSTVREAWKGRAR